MLDASLGTLIVTASGRLPIDAATDATLGALAAYSIGVRPYTPTTYRLASITIGKTATVTRTLSTTVGSSRSTTVHGQRTYTVAGQRNTTVH